MRSGLLQYGSIMLLTLSGIFLYANNYFSHSDNDNMDIFMMLLSMALSIGIFIDWKRDCKREDN